MDWAGGTIADDPLFMQFTADTAEEPAPADDRRVRVLRAAAQMGLRPVPASGAAGNVGAPDSVPPVLPSLAEGPPRALPPRAWQQMDSVDLEHELRRPVKTVRDPPRWFRASLRQAYAIALHAWQHNPNSRTWKAVLLTPWMLLTPSDVQSKAGKEVFSARLRRFLRGEWVQLIT